MKRLSIYGILVVSSLLSAPFAKAQDKAMTKEEPKAVTVHESGPQLKVQIVFSEYEGEKKTKSLPYSLIVSPDKDLRFAAWSKIRMGDRVPVSTSADLSNTQFQYIDVGTNIDCRAADIGEGRFQLALNLERSWVQGEAENPVASAKESRPPEKDFHLPIIRQFRSESTLILSDRNKIETTFATDPTSGKVIRLEITMNVLK